MNPLKQLLLAAMFSAAGVPVSAFTAMPNHVPSDLRTSVCDYHNARQVPVGFLRRAITGMKALFSAARSAEVATGMDVQVSGRVLAKGSHRNEVVRAMDEQGRCIAWTTTNITGRFRLRLPRDARFQLHFTKPGHLEKVVKVDTHHAVNDLQARRLNRSVRFDVVLVRSNGMPDQGYDGPVGTISFVRGSGLMKVHHHERSRRLSADH